jgi:XRE family transcriptional regulator, regulator of sulfur utilization
MNLGYTLRTVRKRKGYSQQELATKANISRSYLSLIENDECNPSIETITSLCDVLEIPFPVISFLSMDIDSISEEKRSEFRRVKPAIEAMINKVFFDTTSKPLP